MSEPLKILVVEDIKSHSMMFESALRKAFPDSEINVVETLHLAQDSLRHNAYDAIVSDCGFPTEDREERLHGNRNGIRLMAEIRRGDYGKYNAITPIAFNSAEMDTDKKEAAERIGGNTMAFRKGSYYPGLNVGTNAQNFTVESVTGGTVRWLKEQLTEAKIAEREVDSAEPEVPEKANWRSWFSSGKGSQPSRSRH